MKKFEYRTINVPIPVDDKTFNEHVEDETKELKRALERGEKYREVGYSFSTIKTFTERLNLEGKDGWQAVGMFPGGAPSLFGGGSITVNITLMREIDSSPVEKLRK